jgi:raffinose/stachyose/melibiose transport system substrate-binding protein
MDRAFLETAPDGADYYGIPENLDTWGFYYNKAIFEANNIAVPETWDEFIAACQTLKDAGITPLAVDGNIDVYMNWYVQTLMARIAGYDTFLATAKNEEGTTWDTPEFLRAAQMAVELIPFYQEGYQGSQFPAAQIEFSQGAMAMIGMGTWLPGEIRDSQAPDFSMDIFRFPAIPDGNGDQTAVELNWLGWAIPKGAAHPEETIRFIKFITSKSIQEEHVTIGRNVAVIKGLPFPEGSEGAERMINEAESSWPLLHDLRFQVGDWYSSVYLPISTELMFGDLTPEEYISQLQSEHENFYK